MSLYNHWCMCRLLVGFILCFYCIVVMSNEISSVPLGRGQPNEEDVREAIAVLKDAVVHIIPYLDMNITIPPQRCTVLVHCRFICFDGRITDLSSDLEKASDSSLLSTCEIINELRIYRYEFPDTTIFQGFLGDYIDKIELIYIGMSNVTRIEEGAFGGGIFRHIMLEELHLYELEEGMFTSITTNFKSLSIVQIQNPMLTIYRNFLYRVKYQIERLTLQVGISCIRNVTASETVLGKLANVDFSYNDFGATLENDAFHKLTMVETLSLSHSNIEYLPNYIFQNMYQTLKFLDISHNKLVTISKKIFGFQPMCETLRVEASGNSWHCDCNLHDQMVAIFAYQSVQLYCSTPDVYSGMSVFNNDICNAITTEIPEATTQTQSGTETKPTYENDTNSTTDLHSTSTTIAMNSQTFTSTRIPRPPEDDSSTTGPTEMLPEIVMTKCGSSHQGIRWPEFDFFPTAYETLTMKIRVEPTDEIESLGLFWFSKTTKSYYMMEMLPDDFGLGCYSSLYSATLVPHLVPDIAYTFCLIENDQAHVSPLSCKSAHVGGNINIYYNSWLSQRMRVKGISLFVLGVVIFLFLGILIVYLLLKQKPTLLKGSRRVVQPNSHSDTVVILPRKHHKNNKIILPRSYRSTHCSLPCTTRRNSIDSMESTDSYMNANLYEVIPAYMSFDQVPKTPAPSPISFLDPTKLTTAPSYTTCEWITPRGGGQSVRYAQIPPRTKRASSDPLPALPRSQQTAAAAPSLLRISDASAEYITAATTTTTSDPQGKEDE